MTITYHELLSRSGRIVGDNPDSLATETRWTTQKPYRNGVVVYTWSSWLGNGFGNSTEKVAVRGNQIVATYANERMRSHAEVVGVGKIYSDTTWIGHGKDRRPVTQRTALSKWIEAVKALPAKDIDAEAWNDAAEYSEARIREQANVVAAQAEAIANGTVVGPRYAAMKRLQNNVETLAAWIGDDR